MGCVYVATCVVNGKQYVGQTKATLRHRKIRHCYHALAGRKTAFYNALRKYGPEAFIWESLFESSDVQVLKEQEVYFISELKTKCPNGYNLTDGGDGLIGCTEETRKKIGKAHRGMKRPPRTAEYRKKIGEARRLLLEGPGGEEFREKMRKARLASFDGPSGEELRRKIGSGNRGKKMSEAQKEKLRTARVRFLDSDVGRALCAKYSELYRGRKLNKETRTKMGRSRIGNRNAARKKD